jgi:voltage-gated potassium channel Kch
MFIMTYFSFVTLTTLGYGDISPVTPVAQVLVVLEAVTGMFYIAIIVASLIGAAMRHR